MTTRYQEKHYEDVARILAPHCTWRDGDPLAPRLAHDFADLFAADNPPSSRCWHCGDTKEAMSTICTRPNEGHSFGGFNREQFLAACGLEQEED